MTTLVTSREDFLRARTQLHGKVGLVLTMGALHDGHASLIDTARAECDSVIVTVFVNPLQFNDLSDLARYPRTLEADTAVVERHGAELLWAPTVHDIYTAGGAHVTVEAGPLGTELEGAARPGHFSGMLTVVAKFLNLIRPDVAYFGEKDYQQLTLIRRMVLDLEIGPRIAGVPTVREADGLAMSSRNVFLSPEDRRRALGLSHALLAGRAVAEEAKNSGEDVQEIASRVEQVGQDVLAEAGISADYLELRGADLGAVRRGMPARLLVASIVGDVRLIDNIDVSL